LGYIEERKRQGEDKRDNGGKPFNDKVCPNIKEGERSTQIVGYGQRQRALSSHVNRYWERKSVLTRGYFFEIVGIEKVYA
jgi:hypothetical protein